MPGYACFSKNGWHMYASFRAYHLRSTLAANISPAGTQGMSGALCAWRVRASGRQALRRAQKAAGVQTQQGRWRQRLSLPQSRRRAPAPDSRMQHTLHRLPEGGAQGAGARAPRNVTPSSVCSALMNTCMMTCSGACAAGNWPGSWKCRTMPGAGGGASRRSGQGSSTTSKARCTGLRPSQRPSLLVL
jgi:hypothetical protein